ncbi:MAG: hypothetical protein ACTHNB_05715 [Gaiellaceae bacterium]
MRWLALIGVLGIAATFGSSNADSAATKTLCVGGTGCFSTIQAAVDAAQDGDTITVSAGQFAGGISIDKSVNLKGAGPNATTISGGGPVLTLGVFGAAREPTVTIAGVTITGGSSTSSPMSNTPGVNARGGGIEIPPAAGSGPGATVTLTNSVIRDNRARPGATAPLGPPCPGGPCPFAGASGGGIDNWGSLTLDAVTVSRNSAEGYFASDALGGGIWSGGSGKLVLSNTEVSLNRCWPWGENGRFAEGGGIFVESGRLSITGSLVSKNYVILGSKLPSMAGGKLIEINANSGGIHVNDGVPTRIDRTKLIENSVTADDPSGEPLAFDAAMYVGDSRLVMTRSVVSRNQVTGTSATSADVGPGGSALELDGGGTISNTRITSNTAEADSPSGIAAVNGGLAVLNFNHDPKLVIVRDSVISGNTAVASSTAGSARAMGGGIMNGSLLRLIRVQVSSNVGTATGPKGVAQGGGIWNGKFSDPPVRLELLNTNVVHNALRASGGLKRRGGGLFTTFPVKRRHSRIARNAPDQCIGC